MKPEDKERILKAIFSLEIARRSGSHSIYHAIVSGPDLEREVIQPLKELAGWSQAQDADVELAIADLKQTISGHSMSKSSGAARMAFKIATAAVAAGGIGYAAWKLKNRKKETVEK